MLLSLSFPHPTLRSCARVFLLTLAVVDVFTDFSRLNFETPSTTTRNPSRVYERVPPVRSPARVRSSFSSEPENPPHLAPSRQYQPEAAFTEYRWMQIDIHDGFEPPCDGCTTRGYFRIHRENIPRSTWLVKSCKLRGFSMPRLFGIATMGLLGE